MKVIPEEEMDLETGEEMDDDYEEEVMVGQMPTVMVPRHIKKRSLKNKALSVSFDEKSLRDYVTGFHKRKKKRRKEAQKQIEEKLRLKRIALRKKRKEEKELALYGKLQSDNADNNDEDKEEEEEEPDLPTTVAETRTYEGSSTKVIVTTSEISHADADLSPKHVHANPVNSVERNPSLAVKKKPLKALPKKRSHKKGKKGSSHKKDKKSKKGRNNKGRKK